MNHADLRAEVWEEIEHIPDDRILELYQLVHGFRVGLEPTTANPMSFADCWGDLPEAIYDDFISDIYDRCQQAFLERRDRETRTD